MTAANGKRKRVPKDVTTESLECRILGHEWEEVPPWDPAVGTIAYGHFVFSMRCVRCTKTKDVAWHRKTGEILVRRYSRPEGYHTISRDFHMSDFRLELIRRWSA